MIYMVYCDWKVPVWFACGCHVPAILSQEESSWSRGDSHPTQCLCCLEGHHFRVSDVEMRSEDPQRASAILTVKLSFPWKRNVNIR